MESRKCDVTFQNKAGESLGTVCIILDSPEKAAYRADRMGERITRIIRDATRAFDVLTRCNDNARRELERGFNCADASVLFRDRPALSMIGPDRVYLSALLESMENAVGRAYRENEQAITIQLDI